MKAGRVLLLGATGTIGGATLAALRARGHEVVCAVRPGALQRAAGVRRDADDGTLWREAWFHDAAGFGREALRGERFEAVVSCMASRSGVPADAWAVDHLAHRHVLQAALEAGIGRFVLLSAICVQKPRLAFQHAKLAFERELMEAGPHLEGWSIVRPTAYFKSLCGQVERVRRGEPYLLFGDGQLTACKPIADADLAEYLVGCLDEEGSGEAARRNRVLPIGGPGPALTPREQGERLFALFGRAPRFRSVPTAMLSATARLLSVAARLAPGLAAKAELARIGHYYATESMLVWDAARGRYDAEATPSFGRETLFERYARIARGELPLPGRGEHAVF